MKKTLLNTKAITLATQSKDYIPNIVPITSWWLHDDETIHIADNYMGKTLSNLQENPKAAVYIPYSVHGLAFQMKGSVKIENEGADYENMRMKVKEKNPNLPAKNLVIINIEEIVAAD